MRLLLLSICSLLISLPAVMAQEKSPETPDPKAWSLRVYRFPSDQLSQGFVTRDKGQLRAPAMPAANASEKETIAFLKKSTDIVSAHLTEQGVIIPNGTLFAYDRTSMMLAVRTNAVTHDTIAAFSEQMIGGIPQYIAFNLRLLEADADVIRTAVKDASVSANHSSILARLEALADQGQARRLDSMKLETRSGQRVAMTSAQETRHSTEFGADEKGNAAVVQEMTPVGTTLELDPVSGPDGRTLDVNYNMKYHYAAPTLRWEPANLSGPRRIELRATDFHTVSLASAVTLSSDSTKLLGVWAPEAVPGAEAPKKLQAAFLRGCIVSVLPATDDRAEGLIKTFGEKADPTPSRIDAKKDEQGDVPPGMIVRRYHIPPDFLSMGGASAPAAMDPFAAAAPPPANEPRFTVRVTALDILRQQGIIFPQGSSANFSSATSELVVRNTPKNLEAVEAFIDSIRNKIPQNLIVTLHIVQCDAAFMRKMESDTLMIADHATAFGKVEAETAQGRAKFLRTVRVETRSGQRSTISAGDDRMISTGLELGPFGSETQSSGETPKTADAKDEKAPQAIAHATAAQGSSLELSGFLESTRVGTDFEVDPVIGPDGVTVDLNFAIHYDYAQPSVRHDPAPDGEKVLKLEAPATDFHKATLASAMVLSDGMTRLVGVWKPQTLADGQNKDVLQAAFIRVNLIDIEKKPEK